MRLPDGRLALWTMQPITDDRSTSELTADLNILMRRWNGEVVPPPPHRMPADTWPGALNGSWICWDHVPTEAEATAALSAEYGVDIAYDAAATSAGWRAAKPIELAGQGGGTVRTHTFLLTRLVLPQAFRIRLLEGYPGRSRIQVITPQGVDPETHTTTYHAQCPAVVTPADTILEELRDYRRVMAGRAGLFARAYDAGLDVTVIARESGHNRRTVTSDLENPDTASSWRSVAEG